MPRFDETEKAIFENIMHRMNDVRNQVKLKRKSAADQYKAYYDRHMKTEEPTYRPGQLVYLRTNNVRPQKLEAQFHNELFEVSKVLNSDKYGQLIQLTDVQTKRQVDSQIHPNRLRLSLDYSRINGEITKNNTHEKMVEITGGNSPTVEFVSLTTTAADSNDRTRVADDLNRNKSLQQTSDSNGIQQTSESTTQSISSGTNPGAAASIVRPPRQPSRIFFGRHRPGRRPQN